MRRMSLPLWLPLHCRTLLLLNQSQTGLSSNIDDAIRFLHIGFLDVIIWEMSKKIPEWNGLSIS